MDAAQSSQSYDGCRASMVSVRVFDVPVMMIVAVSQGVNQT